MINALKHIRKMFEQAWRYGAGDTDDEDAPGEYSHVKDADVKILVGALKAHLGGDQRRSRREGRRVRRRRPNEPVRSEPAPAASLGQIKDKGMPHLRAHCMHFSNLPPQVY